MARKPRGPNRPTTPLGELRHASGLTLQQAAEALGVSWPYLSNVERGEDAPSGALILRMSKAYGIPAPHVEAAVNRGLTMAYARRAGVA